MMPVEKDVHKKTMTDGWKARFAIVILFVMSSLTGGATGFLLAEDEFGKALYTFVGLCAAPWVFSLMFMLYKLAHEYITKGKI